MNLVLLGPPGAGKGTQSKVLSQKLNIPHISTGDLLRETVGKNMPLGNEAKGYMIRGELVPDGLVMDIVKDTLATANVNKGFILDGFPRTLEQAKMLDLTLEKIGKKIDLAIYFKTSVQTSVVRLGGRRVCKKCGANFHIKNIPPKKEGVCDYCGSELCQRKDDREETVKRRWAVYNEETAPLINYYKSEGILREVSGDLDVNELNKILMALFHEEKLI